MLKDFTYNHQVKKVLITGGSGYIGKNVLEKLVNMNYEIHVVSRYKSQKIYESSTYWHQVDLIESDDIQDLMSDIKPEFLIHLAWKVGSGLKHDLDENKIWLEKSKELIKCFYLNGGKKVLISGTCAEYDWNFKFMREDETPLNPTNEYGKIKLDLYRFVHSYCTKNNLNWVWPRIFFSFGPHQKEGSLVPSIIKNLMAGEIVNTTEATQKFDYLYVEDIALAILFLLDNEYMGAINICSGQTIELKKIILSLADHFESRNMIRFGSIPYPEDALKEILGDNSILRGLGWKPSYRIEDGLEKTINYFKKRFNE